MVHQFRQIDVFCSDGISGNPLAVVHDAEGIDDTTMVRFSSWTNLAEVTYLLPPTDPAADYRVRIFNLERELPFAGHPTLGSARSWLAAGGRPATPGAVVQECGIGLVSLRVADGQLAFAAPPLRRCEPLADEELTEVCARFGLALEDVADHAHLDNGINWSVLLLHDPQRVLAVDGSLSAGVPDVGLVAPGSVDDTAVDLVVRGFFRDGTGATREDSVTGSLNASVARWLTEGGRLTAPYVAAQGHRLGRRGRVVVRAADDELWIGGRTEVVIEGTVTL